MIGQIILRSIFIFIKMVPAVKKKAYPGSFIEVMEFKERTSFSSVLSIKRTEYIFLTYFHFCFLFIGITGEKLVHREQIDFFS